MKWFKHDTGARNDTKLKLLKKKFKAEGYGVYFQLLEIVGENIKDNNHNDWGFVEEIHTIDTLADESGVSPDKLRSILQYCNELGLLYQIEGRLCVPKILRRLDEFSQRNKADLDVSLREKELTEQGREQVGTKSGQDRVLEQIRTEQIRTDKKREERVRAESSSSDFISVAEPKKYSSIHDLTESDVLEISERYSIPVAFVASKLDDMVLWHKSTGKVRKDWKATLANWVKRDAVAISQRRSDVNVKRGIDASHLG